jgi:hypothetical protein
MVVLSTGQIAEQVNEDRDRLEQAAGVLLLLQRPLDDVEQRNRWRLFECRLRQAYAREQATEDRDDERKAKLYLSHEKKPKRRES